MIFNRRLINFVEYSYNSMRENKDEQLDRYHVLDDVVIKAAEDLLIIPIESDEYTKASESFKNVCESKEKIEKIKLEQKKVELQISENYKRRYIDWSQLGPKILGIVVYGGVTCVLLCLERQTPLSMRWLRALEELISPRM